MAKKEKETNLVKKYVRYDEGVELFGMCLSTLVKRAREADAIHKVGKIPLVNVEKFEKYIETF